MKFSMSSRYKIALTDKDGNVTKETPWFENLITNQGLDYFGVTPAGVGNYQFGMYNAWVGVGNTAPAYTDTTMTSPLYPGTWYGSNPVSSYVAGPPAYWSSLYTYKWASGAIVGNIAEVGVGTTAGGLNTSPGASNPPLLVSHALIVDGSGNPTTVSVTALDTLNVTYEFRVYLNVSDTAYSVTINGTSYTGVYRPARVNSYIVNGISQIPSNMGSGNFALTLYSGGLAAITSYPSSIIVGLNTSQGLSATASAYTIGTYTLSLSLTIPPNKFSTAGTINTIEMSGGLGDWQFSITPGYLIQPYQNFVGNFSLSWGRH